MKIMQERMEDVIIIGAGPAGLAAALQLERAGVRALVFEHGRPGGLLWNANLVENYPGFPGGISGAGLAQLIEKQAGESGVRILRQEVTALVYVEDIFKAITGLGTWFSRRAIIASGTRPRMLEGIAVPEALQNKIVYDLFPLLNQTGKCMAIMGAGDAAFDYALNLSKQNEVMILNRHEKTRCLPLLWERVRACSAIVYKSGTRLLSVSQASPGGIELACSGPSGPERIQADYLIAAIGREPRLDFLSSSILEKQELLREQGRLFFCGDVKNGKYRQAAIAAGDGLLAAMKIQHELADAI